jgi:demethylmenaquinone methyltransferase/2-methoxy-6-polyprenyl-1,4-benzoquinol methylase
MTDPDVSIPSILREQVAYYRARAPEYDEWFLRQGRYALDEAQRTQWHAELAEVERTLRAHAPLGDVLEVACGTGLWTQYLAPIASHVTAVDAAPEALTRARVRVPDSHVETVEADLFSWTPYRQYDFVFAGFWLSHIPRSHFTLWWERMREVLRAGGRVMFVDSLFNPTSAARDHHPDTSGIVERRLNDGRRFNVVKVYYDPDDLQRRLETLGWIGSVTATGEFFLCGMVHRTEAEAG